MSAFTRFQRWGNGGEGPREGYSQSMLRGMWTAQQLAAALSLSQGGARDIMSGRVTGVPLGKQIKGTWFIDIHEAVKLILERNP